MVEANADPEVVTAVIRRETREAASAARAARLATASSPASTHPSPRPLAAGESVVEPVQSTSPTSASAGLWNVQFAIALVLVIVLFFVWIAERRNHREGAESNGQR